MQECGQSHLSRVRFHKVELLVWASGDSVRPPTGRNESCEKRPIFGIHINQPIRSDRDRYVLIAHPITYPAFRPQFGIECLRDSGRCGPRVSADVPGQQRFEKNRLAFYEDRSRNVNKARKFERAWMILKNVKLFTVEVCMY